MSDRFGHIQFKTGEFGIADESRIRFAQVLTMVQRKTGERAALGGDLL